MLTTGGGNVFMHSNDSGMRRENPLSGTPERSAPGQNRKSSMRAYVFRCSPNNGTLLCIDSTKVPLEQTFDVATAFRFFLNAEDPLRRAALRAIYRHLRRGGVLVCNVQLNGTSPMGLVSLIMSWAYPRIPRNTLTLDRFSRLLSDEGFEVVESTYYGYLPRPGRLFPRLCEALIVPFEKACRRLRVPGWFAESFIVVARKRQFT